MKNLLFIIILLFCSIGNAQEVIVSYDESTLSVLNEELRWARERIDTIETEATDIDLTSEVSGVLPVENGGTGGLLPLAYGGTGTAFTDPGADRIIFWDDSESTTAWLTPNTGIEISGTNLNVTASTSGGWEFVETGTIADATTVTITETLAEDTVYRLVVEGFLGANDTNIYMTINADSSGSEYSWIANGLITTPTEIQESNTGDDEIRLHGAVNATPGYSSYILDATITVFESVTHGSKTMVSWQYSSIKDSSGCITTTGAGVYDGGLATTIELISSYAAQLNGRYYLYKMTKS